MQGRGRFFFSFSSSQLANAHLSDRMKAGYICSQFLPLCRCSRVRVLRVAVPKNILYNPRVPSARELPRWRANFQVSASTRVGVPISVSAWLLNTRTQSDCACRGDGQACMPRSANLAGVTNCCWIHPTLYLKWMPRREWRDTIRIGFLDRREAWGVFKLDYHKLTKIGQMWRLLMRVEKRIMVLSLVPEPTRRNIQHLKDYFVFQVFFFDSRTFAVSWSTRYASAQRAELRDSCTA